MFCLLFRRNLWILIERKTSITILRKIRGPRKPRASGKQSRGKQQLTRPCNRGRNHARAEGRDARPPVCGGARSAVSLGTTVSEAPVPRGFTIFGYLFVFSLWFRGTSGGFLGRVLGRKLGFRIASIKPFRGRLD